jgi:hypothetical protein
MTPHPVTSRPLGQEEKRRAPRIGFIRPGSVERAFVALLYTALLLLVLLSVLGTFYGLLGRNAPINAPLLAALPAMTGAVAAAPNTFLLAVIIQIVLTTIQYGARQMSKSDRRWWILYLVSLGISVYYNYQAYWTPLNTMTPAYLAALLIIAGDVLPEFIAVKRE